MSNLHGPHEFRSLDSMMQSKVVTGTVRFLELRGTQIQPAVLMDAMESINPVLVFDSRDSSFITPPTFRDELLAYLLGRGLSATRHTVSMN